MIVNQIRINPLVEMPGDFWLSTIKHRLKFTKICKNWHILDIIIKKNPLESPEFEFKPNNPYPDIYIIVLIQKTTLVDFSLPLSNTVFELDYFGLIPALVLFADPQAQPRAHAHVKMSHANFNFYANLFQN